MKVHDHTKSDPKAVKVWKEGEFIMMDAYKKDNPSKSTTTVSRKMNEKHWHIHYMRTNCSHCDEPSNGESCGRIHGFRQQMAYERAYKLFAERNGMDYLTEGKEHWKV